MNKTKLGLLVLALILLIVLSSKFIHGPFNNLTSSFSFKLKSSNLQKIVQKNLAGKTGEYAVYIEDLTDGEIYTLRPSDVFPAASLYKVYLLAVVLKEVDSGHFTLERTLQGSKSHLIEVLGDREFGIQDLPAELELTVDEALTRVGRISDNFASVMLAEAVGWEKIQSMADSLGAKNTRVYPPEGGFIETTVQDLGLFFKKLQRKEIVSLAVSEAIIKYLALNQINDRLGKIGEVGGVKVIHKTGELPKVRHDAGMVCLNFTPSEVFCSGRTYVIVLMSKDLEFEDEGVETLAQISKDVYEYFKGK